jgi:threonine/homoserine efflux transporter RhtA
MLRECSSDRSPASQTTEERNMNIQLGLAPIIALLAGILILVTPRLLNYIVAIYLIVIGVLGIVGAGGMRLN